MKWPPVFGDLPLVCSILNRMSTHFRFQIFFHMYKSCQGSIMGLWCFNTGRKALSYFLMNKIESCWTLLGFVILILYPQIASSQPMRVSSFSICLEQCNMQPYEDKLALCDLPRKNGGLEGYYCEIIFQRIFSYVFSSQLCIVPVQFKTDFHLKLVASQKIHWLCWVCQK